MGRGRWAILVAAGATLAACGARPPATTPQHAALRLSVDHTYLREREAPDFWSLIPYYVAQPTDAACSVAVVSMLLNGLGATRAMGQLATPESVLERVADSAWSRNTRTGGAGVTLSELREIVARALMAYGYGAGTVHVAVYSVADASSETLDRVRALLVDNERSKDDFLVANFLQSTLTGDADAAVGHLALIGAFDETRQRVLLLDPDRQWYEPYWVSPEKLVAAMATVDPVSGRPRGLLLVKRSNQQ